MSEVLNIIMIGIGGILIGVGSKAGDEGSAMITGGCVMISMTLYYAVR